jgi:hypothetical protein
MLIGVLCGGLLLGAGATQADGSHQRFESSTWEYRGGWDHRDRYRPRGPRARRHALPRPWTASRWNQPGLRRDGSALIWAVSPRHFWPTQRWARGLCYRVEHLPFGRVRHVPLPKAACF